MTSCRKGSGVFERRAVLVAWAGIGALCWANEPVAFTVRLDGERHEISPLIYGLNDWARDANTASINYTLERQGGNRMTGYNWENNFSNAGSDYIHHSDGGLVSAADPEDRLKPGEAVRMSVDHAQAAGRPSLVTLQLAGYVAADKNGTVSESQAAPSSRWKEVKMRKDDAYSLTPDTSDDFVYLDEQVNFLIEQYGTAEEGGVLGYSLDNEPALWPYTHARLHPEKPTVNEIVSKGAAAAAMVKDLDASALVFGPALYGWGAYEDFQDAPDWASYQDEYDWFIGAYLGEMKKASDAAGKRLLDVLDIHYYPEVAVVTGTDGSGNDVYTRVTDNASDNEALAAARLQAPRSLWDESYVEQSWVTQWSTSGEPLRVLPRIHSSIEARYAKTLLSISEYDFGGRTNYSGGLAQADVLGIFGREGIYAACFWGEVDGFIEPAFQLYRNYDGENATFGSASVPVENPEVERFSCYAAIDPEAGTLHVIAINKTDEAREAVIDLSSDSLVLERMRAYGFSEATGPEIVSLGERSEGLGDRVSIELPARSATHYVFESRDVGYDRLVIDGVGVEGRLRALYRPSVGSDRALETSADLAVWAEQIERIAGDGLTRALELRADGTAGFWRVVQAE